jgi:MoxR-like ATPase
LIWESARAVARPLSRAQALALTEGRNYCVPDDVKQLVIPSFAHRVLVSSRYASSLRRSEEAEAALKELMKTISVPL